MDWAIRKKRGAFPVAASDFGALTLMTAAESEPAGLSDFMASELSELALATGGGAAGGGALYWGDAVFATTTHWEPAIFLLV